MEFKYIQRECDLGVLDVPTLPMILNGFPVGHAFVDTGADMTLLPMEINNLLGLELDTEHAMDIQSAGGGVFKAIPAATKVTYTIEHSGFRPIVWKGTVFFAPRQPTILLGQFECLSELIITLNGKTKKIYVDLK